MIVVIGRDDCPHCETAKRVLQEKGVPFHALKIGVDIQVETIKRVLPDSKTVPIVLDVTSIGGLAEMIDYINGEKK